MRQVHGSSSSSSAVAAKTNKMMRDMAIFFINPRKKKKTPISPFLHSERTKIMMMIENDLFIFNGHPTELNDGGGF